MSETSESYELLQQNPQNCIASDNDSDIELREVEVHNTNNIDILLQAGENNEEELAMVLLQLTKESVQQKHSQYNSKNIVTISCERSEVSVRKFEILYKYVLDHFPDLNLMEEQWYYWEPIHFAARNMNLEKLRIITENLRLDRVNALSVFSENALHVLLKYGKRAEPFYVELSNGYKNRICRVIPPEQAEMVKCTEELINAGIDYNHINIWNETPLIIAIRFMLIGVIKLLVKQENIDLDTCKDPNTGKSSRDLLRDYEIGVHFFTPTSTVVNSPKKILFSYLKSGDEEKFLRYNNENIKQYANEIDGDSESNSSGTMLQLCLLKGYIEYKRDTSLTESNNKDIMNTSMLKVFCQKGFVKSIEHLLHNGAEITKKHRFYNNQDVFQISVKLCYYPFLAILLQHRFYQIKELDIFKALTNILLKKMSEIGLFRHVLYLLISKLEIILFQDILKPQFNRTVLSSILDMYLINNKSGEFDENILQALRIGASLVGDRRTFIGLELISEKILRHHLDECIDHTNTVCYNSFILDKDGNYSEIKALEYLIKDTKKFSLLNHPAVIALIYAKWLKVDKFFKANIAFYSIFLLSLYVYMVSLEINNVHPATFYIFMILVVFQSIKELTQLLLYRCQYLGEIMNGIEVLTLIFCYINMFTKNEATMVLAVLLSTLIFLLMLGELPSCTKFMMIFSSTKYFIQYALFYSLQLFSFALCFFILFPLNEEGKSKSGYDVFIRTFDTLFFFIGQFDGPISNPEDYPVFGRIIVAIFIFCMTIILNNLLVGLIVTDMDVIRINSKSLRQLKMIKYIVKTETFLKQMAKFSPFRIFKTLFEKNNIFLANTDKYLHLAKLLYLFDEDDKLWLNKIHANRQQRQNIIKKLYDHIIREVYTDPRSNKGNQDILYKLTKLEEQLRKHMSLN